MSGGEDLGGKECDSVKCMTRHFAMTRTDSSSG